MTGARQLLSRGEPEAMCFAFAVLCFRDDHGEFIQVCYLKYPLAAHKHLLMESAPCGTCHG